MTSLFPPDPVSFQAGISQTPSKQKLSEATDYSKDAASRGVDYSKESLAKGVDLGKAKLQQAVGLGKTPNVVPDADADISGEPRKVEIGWHPVGGFAGKWFAEQTGLGKMITEGINKYPDPTQHWAVLVGDYGHQLWMVSCTMKGYGIWSRDEDGEREGAGSG